MAELKQTKSSFKLRGKVTGIDKDNAFKEEVMRKEGNKNDGKLYRSLAFGVKTSDTNQIRVSMFDYEPEEVFLWNSEKKEADKDYKGEKIAYGIWEAKQDELREQGYAVLQARVGVEYYEDDKGKQKLDSKGLPSYVASEYIYNNLNNGDSVVVEGEIRYSKYKNRNDEEVSQTTYTIKKLFLLKDDIDFEDDNFEEVTYFEQVFIFVDAIPMKKENKMVVTGRIIDYNGNFIDTNFAVKYHNTDETVDKPYDDDMLKLAEAFKTKFKFGDKVSVYGDAINRVVYEEVKEEDKEKVNVLASLGGKKKPAHAMSSRSYINDMEIHGVSEWVKKAYKAEDFVKKELLEKDDSKGLKDELGGKSKKKNPFKIDEEDEKEIEIDEDSLPF